MLLTTDARGVFPIAPTPFFEDGRIDTASVDRLTDFYLGIGATGITVLGQLGEAPKLEHAESVAVARRMIRRAAQLPVVVGVSAPGFAAMRALTHEVMTAGDYPLAFSVQMSPGVIRRIVDELPSCVMLKHEDWPGLEKIGTLRGWEREGALRHIAILCGNGGLFLDYEMERGADGANTGYAFPDMLCDVVRLSQAGQREEAHDLFDAHLPLLRYEQQPGVGLAVRKYVLMRRGLLASASQRQPAAPLTAAARAEVDHLLQRLARRDPRALLLPV